MVVFLYLHLYTYICTYIYTLVFVLFIYGYFFLIFLIFQCFETLFILKRVWNKVENYKALVGLSKKLKK